MQIKIESQTWGKVIIDRRTDRHTDIERGRQTVK